MIRVLTASQMREMDRRATEDYGVATLALMENAGRSVARGALCLLDIDGLQSGPPKHQPSFWLNQAGCLPGVAFRANPPKVEVVCGTGNNGGDGFVAARHLANWGLSPTVLLVGDKNRISGDALANHNALIARGLPVVRVTGPRHLQSLTQAELIIDALLGTGTRGELAPLTREAIQAINDSPALVLSVDIPSGVEADTGSISSVAVSADVTMTMAAPKPAHLLFPGAAHTGSLIVADIGIPSALMALDAPQGQFVITPFHVAGLIPERPADSHKGVFGHAGIVAGSVGFAGAAEMAGLACAVTGAGLTTVVVPSRIGAVMATKLTECMTLPLGDDAAEFGPELVDTVVDRSNRWDAAALGCGIGHSGRTAEFVQGLIQGIHCPVVIDADGLNCLGSDADKLLSPVQGRAVITPHPGEMARLLGTDTTWVQSNRVTAAAEASNAFGCVVVLKGAHTVVAEPEGRICYNVAQSVGLAKGGSGDILTGIIASLLAQGLSPFDASVAGVWMHGRSAQIVSQSQAEPTLLATQCLSAMSDVYTELRANLPVTGAMRMEALSNWVV